MGRKYADKPIKTGVAKVPVIMQMEFLECGAACLAMIMAYYGRWVPLEQVREDCGVSRDGSNALNVLKAARNHGFEAGGYRYEPHELKEEGTFPCIVHWEFNHFIVLCGFKGDKVCVNDPARGSVTMTMDEFDKGFTGICLAFSPGESFERAGTRPSVMGFAAGRLKGAKGALIFMGLTGAIVSVLGIANSGFSRFFMDRLISGTDRSCFAGFMILFTAFVILQIAVLCIQAIYSLRINGRLAAIGSTSFMWKVMNMPMKFFSQRMAGDLQQRMLSNETIASQMVNTLAPLVINIAMTVFYLVVMLRYSVLLTAVGLISILINVLVAKFISSRRINVTRVMMRDAGKLSAATVSGIEMIETIKASGAENGFFEKWSGYHASVNRQMVKYVDIDSRLGIIPDIVLRLSDSGIIILGVYLVMKGQFTPGMVLAFQGFLTSFMAPAMSLITAGQAIQEMRTDMERVGDVMKYPEDEVFAPENSEVTHRKLSGAVEIKNVTFGYSPLAEPLIRDFSLSLKKGSRVAFVGPSGCGKSTISKLVSGLYKPWSGEILFDGKRMDQIERSVFTGSVAVVDQDIILFEDTISNNIKMWDDSIEDFEVIMACRDAKLHEDIMQRAGGYSQKLLEGGRDLSGGQRQRMEIARVLAADPTLIIMDEATSALDAKTEYDVVRNIKDRGITCIVIAHRLSTIRDCDEIIVMDKGKVVERGSHKELMDKNGIYKELVTNE